MQVKLYTLSTLIAFASSIAASIIKPSSTSPCKAGAVTQIVWEPATLVGSLNLHLCPGGAPMLSNAIASIGFSVANTGTFNWMPSRSIASRDSFTIIIIDASGTMVASEPFDITGLRPSLLNATMTSISAGADIAAATSVLKDSAILESAKGEKTATGSVVAGIFANATAIAANSLPPTTALDTLLTSSTITATVVQDGSTIVETLATLVSIEAAATGVASSGSESSSSGSSSGSSSDGSSGSSSSESTSESTSPSSDTSSSSGNSSTPFFAGNVSNDALGTGTQSAAAARFTGAAPSENQGMVAGVIVGALACVFALLL